MAHQEACQLFIEQEIEEGLKRGKSLYSIGKETAALVEKYFDSKIPDTIIRMRAFRIKQKSVTNVTTKQGLETCSVKELRSLIDAGKTFGTIYADPPWHYDNQVTRASTDNHYKTMTLEEIAGLPIGKLTTEKAHLHLWTTNAFLFECPSIIREWGFEYKGVFVWVKPQMGIGNYWRVSHEFLLLGVKGGLTFLEHNEMSWINTERGKHSAKPEKIRNSIERVSPSPRLELFGRRQVVGWTVWGDEIEKDLFYDELNDVE